MRQNDISSRLYSFIALLLGESRTRDDLVIEARTGETIKLWKISLLVNLCKAFGLKRRALGGPGAYGLDVARNYEESDFAACELLLLGGQPKHQIEDNRDSEGRLLLTREFTHGLEIGSVWNWTVVSAKVRQCLEQADLIGLQFRKAVSKDASTHSATFWELQSSIVLPKMASTNLMYCSYRTTPPQPFTGDYSRMVFIDDPPYRSGEIHYRCSDLAPLGKIDVARTFELYRQPHQELVVSQRFYQVCKRNGIPLNGEPVRVEP